jgi:type IV pilus assembly protein PilN
MIRINLLPFRAARKKENIRRQISVFILSLFLVTAILSYASGFWTKKINLLNARIEQINRELTITTAAAKEVDRIKKDLDDLKKKTDVIRNLEKTRREPIKLLDAMTGLVVKNRMWFTDFTDIQKTIKIKGIALDNKTVADFMTQLEGSGLFSTVNLDSLKQQTLKDTLSLKSFEITCQKAEANNAPDTKAASS